MSGTGAAVDGRPAPARGRLPVSRLAPLAALAEAPLVALLVAAGAAVAAAPAPTGASAPSPTGTGPAPCRLKGVEHEARCGSVRRPLDPSRPQGAQIEVHYAVLPALARRKAPDPVFFFAGGPGQSAIDLAGVLAARFGRLANRRDMVFVDQRGTGRSAPLKCPDDDERAPVRPLAEQLDEALALARLQDCRAALQRLPHGDLRQYTTAIAMADIDAVRAYLGAPRINAIGGSYGTRAVLEYLRQFPQRVRRAVIDGVAPPDMVLPASFSADNQAALDALLDSCERDDGCRSRFPALRTQWRGVLASLPREVRVIHPVTGREEALVLTRQQLLGAVRGPLYGPVLAAGLPAAITEAAQGRFTPLLGLSAALGGAGGLATGMHFSVVCAEDMPRLQAVRIEPGADFGDGFLSMYRRACADWPRGDVPAAFYTVPAASSPTLVLSGGIDPATPPRHGQRVAAALGPRARHIVVPNGGHGVMALPCVRDALLRFIDIGDDEAALKVDADCAAAMPRPGAFVPIGMAQDAALAGAAGGRP